MGLFNKSKRTPIRIQVETAECGAVALGIVLEYHGKYISSIELREKCGVSRDGSRAANVLRAARHYGLNAVGKACSINLLATIPGPYIAYLKSSHCVVIERESKWNLYINDPAKGRYSVAKHIFQHSYSGIILCFDQTAEFQQSPTQKNEGSENAIQFQDRSNTALIMSIGIVLSILSVTTPLVVSLYTNEVVSNQRIHWSSPICLGLFFLLTIKVISNGIQLSSTLRLRTKYALQISNQYLWKLIHLPIQFFQQRSPNEMSLRQKIAGENANISSDRILTLSNGISIQLISLTILVMASPILAIVPIVLMIIQTFVLLTTFRILKDPSNQLAWAAGRVEGISLSMLKNIETIKGASYENYEFQKWANSYSEVVSIEQKIDQTIIRASQMLRMTDAVNFVYVVCVWSFVIIYEYSPVGILYAVTTLVTNLFHPIKDILQVLANSRELSANQLRLNDVLSHPTKQKQTTTSRTLTSSQLLQTIRARNLTYGFCSLQSPLIHNVELDAKQGEWIALVGKSGSGKSTLLRLLAGIYEPWGGTISYDNTTRDHYSKSTLQKSIGYVNQDIEFFDGTIKDNLTLWDDEVHIQNILTACDDACITQELMNRTDGLNSLIFNNSTGLSGGQLQRLEIARALSRNPSILLLDEATSAIDKSLEIQILANIRKRNITVILSTHRLDMIQMCEQILIIDGGQIIDRGTHDELSCSSPTYQQLISVGE